MDKKIGELMDFLEAEGWLENSIIVVASDNGGCPDLGGCNYPLKGVKQSVFEGGTKVKGLIPLPKIQQEQQLRTGTIPNRNADGNNSDNDYKNINRNTNNSDSDIINNDNDINDYNISNKDT